MEILQHPDPAVTERSELVEDFGEQLQKLVQSMFNTIDSRGAQNFAGLAAPQVGVNVRVFIAFGNVFVNPEIVWKTKAIEFFDEGCFSIGNGQIPYRVKRATSIRMKWQDLHGDWHEQRFNGYQAEVLQHEYDHLEGLTIKEVGWQPAELKKNANL